MLHDYLDRMREITDRASPHRQTAAPDSVVELARTRAEQARTITSYQLYVHREIFEPTIRGGSAKQIAQARAMKVECILLAEDFRAFARLWAIDNVIGQWNVYQPAALALRDRIRDHIGHMRENASLLPDSSGALQARTIY